MMKLTMFAPLINSTSLAHAIVTRSAMLPLTPS